MRVTSSLLPSTTRPTIISAVFHDMNAETMLYSPLDFEKQ